MNICLRAYMLEEMPKFQWVEFFAGKAEATRMFREAKYRTGRLDINYMRPRDTGFNPMDLCSDAGFGLLGIKVRFNKQFVVDLCWMQ